MQSVHTLEILTASFPELEYFLEEDVRDGVLILRILLNFALPLVRSVVTLCNCFQFFDGGWGSPSIKKLL